MLEIQLFKSIGPTWLPRGLLDRFGVDLGGFWEDFFEIWGFLAREMQEPISNLKLKLRNSSLELKVAVLLTSASKFGRDLLPQGQAEIFRRSGWAAVSPPGGFNPPPTEGVRSVLDPKGYVC